jgi:hypothetical protein
MSAMRTIGNYIPNVSERVLLKVSKNWRKKVRTFTKNQGKQDIRLFFLRNVYIAYVQKHP